MSGLAQADTAARVMVVRNVAPGSLSIGVGCDLVTFPILSRGGIRWMVAARVPGSTH